MEGSADGVVDPGLLRARVAELQQELRLRTGEVARLHSELRHARADVVVKDEYIAALTTEADKLERIRELLGRVPYGSHMAQAFEGHLRIGPDVGPTVAARARDTTSQGARRAQSAAGRLKRRARTQAGRLKRRVSASLPQS